MELIREWFESLPGNVREILHLSATFEPGGKIPLGSREAFRDWLSARLQSTEEVNRARITRFVFDTFFDKRERFNAKNLPLESALEIVESEVPPETKMGANRAIGIGMAVEEQWSQVSLSWRTLRETHLTDEALNAWMMRTENL